MPDVSRSLVAGEQDIHRRIDVAHRKHDDVEGVELVATVIESGVTAQEALDPDLQTFSGRLVDHNAIENLDSLGKKGKEPSLFEFTRLTQHYLPGGVFGHCECTRRSLVDYAAP